MPSERTHHGDTVTDEFAWLAQKDNPDTIAYLEAENAYTEAALAGTEALRECLVKEMRGRIKEDDASVPQADGPFAYYTRYREAGSTRWSAASPARAAPNRSSSMVTGRRRVIPSSISATPAIRRITV